MPLIDHVLEVVTDEGGNDPMHAYDALFSAEVAFAADVQVQVDEFPLLLARM